MFISLKQVKLKVPIDAGSEKAGKKKSERLLLSIPDFAIEAGSRLLIQGPSGSGKSSLLHFIAGLFDASSGELKWGEQSVQELTDYQRSTIRRQKFAIIFQPLNFPEHLSFRENIFFALSDYLSLY